MFYLIIAILILIYYVFMMPDTIRNTMKMIIGVGLIVLLFALLVMSVMKILELPGELFVGVGMSILGYMTLTDISKLEKK